MPPILFNKVSRSIFNTEGTYLICNICTIPVNLAGLPAVSIPAGLSGNNLPIGLQVMGNVLREDNVIRAAYTLEKAIGFKGTPAI